VQNPKLGLADTKQPCGKHKIFERSLMASGPMERAVRSTLRNLGANASKDARARLAITLAITLDGDAGMATAAVSRELRATLTELESRDDNNTNDEFAKLIAELSA